ncbi:MAG: hypothetical protein U5L00_17970 [Desulfovermiculus sp.]|nr:hypothetical protein [Desulfovermiculus sp.]
MKYIWSVDNWKAAAFCMLVLILFCSSGAMASNKQLMSQKMAKQDMKRNLVETVVGSKVTSKGEFGLTQDNQYVVKGKAAAILKGAKVDKIIYDPDKDIAFCLGHMTLGEGVTITGDRPSYDDVKVHAFGFGTMTETSKPPLMALRAAMLNAYDELAAILVGEKISSYSEAENFILTEDINKSEVCAAVYGAHIPNPDMDAKDRGWGWDENGNAWVKLRIDVEKVEDLLGNRLLYDQGEVIEVTGHGAQVDEIAEEKDRQQGISGSSTQLKSMDIPVTTTKNTSKAHQETSQGEDSKAESLKGGAVAGD